MNLEISIRIGGKNQLQKIIALQVLKIWVVSKASDLVIADI